MAQRGKLLTYDAATGNGLVALMGGTSAAKLPFAVDTWQSAEPPQVGMVVDVISDQDKIDFRPVAEVDLMKEKLGNFGQQLSQSVGKTLHSDAAQQTALTATSFVDRLGKPTLVGYAVYAAASVFVNFATVHVMGLGGGTSLYDLSTVMAQAGAGSGLRFLLWLSYLSLAVPLFWPNRKAWLAHTMPLATVLLCLYSVNSALSDMQNQMGQLLGSRHTPRLGDFLSFGTGFYVCLLAGGVLAVHGAMKTKTKI